MPIRTYSKSNVIAGVFVVGSVGIAVAISMALAGFGDRMLQTHSYVVKFSHEDGAAGLKPGSIVTLGGQKIGRVSSITVAPESVDVDVSIRSDLTLFEDALAYLERPILGGLASINFADAGDGSAVESPQGGRPELESGEVLNGRLAPPSVLAQAGYGPAQAEQLKEIVSRIDRMVEQIETRDLETIRGALADIRAVAADVRERTPEWSARIDSTLEQAERAVSDFDTVATEMRAGVAEARKVVESAQGLIDRNAEGLDAIVANVESVTRRADAESMALLNDALRRATEGADRFASFMEQAEAALTQELPGLRRVFANARLATDQLKLATVEIRTKPWLLLYSPKTKELESELIHQTARSYAEAVSDLRAASEALQATTAANGLSRRSIEEMTARLHEAFTAYQQAEQRLLDLLIEKRP